MNMKRLDDASIWHLSWDALDWEDDANVPTYTADFETTTVADDCRVWAWATCEVGNVRNKQYGNSIESFMEWCEIHTGTRVYFHNLKFDGKFILHHIMTNGWKWIPVKEECDGKTFTTLISDMGQFYSIRLWFEGLGSIEFLDSLKVIPLPIAAIPKAFGLPLEKLEMDYVEWRETGHVLTQEEKDYITHDVEIAARALDAMFQQDMKRITAGSNAFHDYMRTIGGKRRMRNWFPEPDYDRDIRESGCYRGGFVGVNPRYAGAIQGVGCSFDVNSLYPSVMASAHGEVLPYGKPVRYDGAYVRDPEYPVCIQFVEADFTLKADHIPCIQLKGNALFGETEYVTDSHGMQTMAMTNVDLEMMFQQYDVHDIRYIRGYKFKGSRTLFKDYVDKWTEVKTKASEEGNEGMRTIAKLELNSLYGKFATNPTKVCKRPYLDDGIVKYAVLPPETGEAIYLPVGAFITAYARAFTVSAAQANYSRWVYSDTDSCYFLGLEDPIGMEVHPTKLGAWKREHEYQRIRVLRPKTYCFEEGGSLVVHCAGMPKACHDHVTMEKFDFGAEFPGKLFPKDVSGGTILLDGNYKIKEVAHA